MSNYVVANTKGGAGKTIVSTMIIPMIHKDDEKVINIYEIDDNNKSALTNSNLNFKTIKVNESEDVINEVYFDMVSDADNVNIIDCGGGNDTLAVLNYIKKVNMENITYIIPVNDDIEQFENCKQTIQAIKDTDTDAVIHVFFNRCNKLNESDVKNQFIGFFGSETYGIESRINEIADDIKSFSFVPNSPLFGIIKNSYSMALYDSYTMSQDLVENIADYRAKWVKEGKEVFSTNIKRFTFAKDILDLVEELEIINKIKG